MKKKKEEKKMKKKGRNLQHFCSYNIITVKRWSLDLW